MGVLLAGEKRQLALSHSKTWRNASVFCGGGMCNETSGMPLLLVGRASREPPAPQGDGIPSSYNVRKRPSFSTLLSLG
jgi:hypothetical protein